MTADDLAPIFLAKRVGANYVAKCPAHDDGTASLSFRDAGDRVLMLDRGNCPTESVLAARGLKLSDLYHEPNGHKGRRWVEQDRYEIRNAEGNLEAIHRRWRKPDGSKAFSWERAGGEKDLGGRKVETLPLFGAELLKDHEGEVWLTEGEKAGLAGRRAGLFTLATVTGAASSPDATVLECLRDREVVLWPDNDDAGRKHMDEIARNLQGVAASVSVVRWPDAPPKGDAADFFPARSKEEAVALVREWTPANAEEAAPGMLAPTPAEFLRDEPRNLRRLRTGFGTLDRSTRGGIPAGIVVAFIGAPHAGKTAKLSQIAVRAASEGYFTVLVFKDEGRFAGSVRLGQQLGLDRARLEAQHPAEIALFEQALTDRGIRVPDPDAQEWVLENLIAWAEREAGGKPLFLGVDSIQSVYARCAEDARALREEIDAKMRLLERAAKKGAMVVVTSEANRSAYRNQDEADNIKGMAAGAESRAIEYVSRLMVILTGDAEKFIKAKIEKNSPGGKRPLYYLRFDPVAATFTEITEEDAEAIGEEAQKATRSKVRAKAKDKIREALRTKSPRNARDLEKACGGNKAEHTAARDEMVESEELDRNDEGKAALFSLKEIN